MEPAWKRLFKLRHNEVLGLDIGSSTVKIVQVHRRNGGYAVTAAGTTEMVSNQDNDDKGGIKTTAAVCKCLESSGALSQLAVCGVSGPEVAVRYFKFPSLPASEIEGAVQLEAAQVCPFNVNDGTIDYQLLDDDEGNVSGFLVAATNKLINGKVRLAASACLKTVLMDVEGLALLNCLNELEADGSDGRDVNRTTAILNVGSSHTTLAIMRENGFPFVRDIAYAGNDIVGQVAAEQGISTEAARQILCGRENVEQKPQLSASFTKACEKLIVDVTETLRYYTAQEKAAVVENVFVCGGFSLVPGFVELLDSHISAKAVLWNPFDKMKCDGGRYCEDIVAQQGPTLAVAAGLAMRSI